MTIPTKQKLLLPTLTASLFVLVGCTTQTATNTNVVSNTNAMVNTNTTNENTNAVVTNSNENTNEVVNENTNADQGSEVDISDWLTYTNDEYGFSFKYPSDWEVDGNDSKNISIVIEAISDLPLVDKVAPTSSSSPQLQDQNLTEKNNLELNEASAFGGTLFKTTNTNFFRYIGYIEGGSVDIEYVTYIDDQKITIRYLEGDNADFVDALEVFGREDLIEQYSDNAIDNQVLKQNFETIEKIIVTFQK